MSRLDDLGEILDGYEGREYKSDIVLCKNMLFVLGELDLGSLPASEQLYQQILDGTFDIAYKNDDTIKYCGINYTKDHNEQGERKWGWLTRNDAISQVYTNKFEKYAASRVSHSSLYETIKSAEGKAAVLLLMNDKLPIENNICPILEEADNQGNRR